MMDRLLSLSSHDLFYSKNQQTRASAFADKNANALEEEIQRRAVKCM